MTALISNLIFILILGAFLAKQAGHFSAFYSGLISLAIAVVITYGFHALFISTTNLIWAIIAVSYASFWSALFNKIGAAR